MCYSVDVRTKRGTLKRRKKMQEEMFVCEICKCHTPKRYEGAEPNTCQQCMPLFKVDPYENENE